MPAATPRTAKAAGMMKMARTVQRRPTVMNFDWVLMGYYLEKPKTAANLAGCSGPD
jgi:hypothetical protein